MRLTVIFFFAGFWLTTGIQSGLCGNPTVSPNGSPLRWPMTPQGLYEASFYVDRGSLGNLPEDMARQMVLKSFQEWSDIEYSTLQWIYGGTVSEDITGANYSQYQTIEQNLVVFDSDGSIIDSLVGVGASDTILGFTKLYSEAGTIQSAQAILNGRMAKNAAEQDVERVYATLLHEVGHFTGIDHTQLFTDFAFDQDPDNNLFLPIMFPIESQDLHSPLGLNLDDRMTLAAIYPSDGFYTDLGTLSGTITRPDGTGVQGANVVVAEISKSYVMAFATVSDLHQIGRGGEFEFPGIPPGEYEIRIEPIHRDFVGYAGVGPFTEREDSPSFINPVKQEYYNGERENGYLDQDDPNDRITIEVRAGEEVSSIDFVTNEATSPVNQWFLY